MTQQNDGLISALLLDGEGGGAPLDWTGVERHWNDESFVWVHLDYTHERSKKWLGESSGLDEPTCEALLADETRPRSVAVGDGLLVSLRGVNLNPGSDPDDMVSLHLWIEHNRLITLRRHKLTAVDHVRDTLKNGRGPTNAVGLLLSLADRLVADAGGVVSQLDDEMDALEERVLKREAHSLRGRIADARRTTIGLRRFLSPQRDALSRLMTEEVSWIGERDRVRLRELTDRVTRHVENLDSIRDRAAVTQEELASRLAEQTNRTMYVLSMVAGIFLPLGLLTGLLGINVGGMPGTDSPRAFWIVCAIIVVITIGEVLFLRRKRWL